MHYRGIVGLIKHRGTLPSLEIRKHCMRAASAENGVLYIWLEHAKRDYEVVHLRRATSIRWCCLHHRMLSREQ